MGDFIDELELSDLVSVALAQLTEAILSATVDKPRVRQDQSVEIAASHLLGAVREVGHHTWTDQVQVGGVDLTQAQLAFLVRASNVDSTGDVQHYGMLPATVDLGDSGFARNLNFGGFELVLQGAEAERPVLSLAPTVHLAILAAKETLVASAGDVVNMADGDCLDEHRRVLEPDRVVDSELAVLVGPHRVDVVCVGHEDGVTAAAGYQADRDVVGAELGEGVPLLSGQADAQAELSLVVRTPGEHLRVLVFLSLDVHNSVIR